MKISDIIKTLVGYKEKAISAEKIQRIIEELRQPNNVKLAGKESNEIMLEQHITE